MPTSTTRSLFFDDDEWVAEDWLIELVQAASHYGADVVQGYVETVLPDGLPWALRDPDMFRIDFPEEGTLLKDAYTGNVLIRMSTLAQLGLPTFSAEYNLTGGEDVEFFARIHRDGARIVFTTRAVVYEDLPPSRLTLWGVAKRAFLQGATYSSMSRAHEGLGHTTRRTILKLGVASSRFMQGLIMEQKVSGIPFKRICHSIGLFSGLLGVSPQAYRKTDIDK